MAREEPVVIERYGRPFLVVSRAQEVSDPVESMRAAGLIRAAREADNSPLPVLDLDPATAQAIMADLAAARAAR